MSLIRTRAIATIAAVLVGVVTSGCGSDSSTSGPTGGNTTTDPVASVTIAPSQALLNVGEQRTLTATTLSGTGAVLTGRTVTWSSSNSGIASVASGVVTGVTPGSATITATSEGKSQTAAITVVAPPSGLQATFSSIAPGGVHTCAITAAGKPYCWGANNLGQIGLGSTGNVYSIPQPVSGGLTFTTIAAGMYHTCGLTSVGLAYCWGWNLQGQLGDGTSVDKSAPTAVSGNILFSSITAAGQAGGEHTCALTSTGAAYCWGWNVRGQLGDGTTSNRSTPTAVAGGLTFTSLSAGDLHTCGLTAAGVAYCWGSAAEVGQGTTTDRTTPSPVLGAQTFKSLSASWWGACGITASNDAYCWGYTGSSSAALQPTLIQTFKFASLASGNQFTCGVLTSGAGSCWGVNSSGQLGDGTSADRTTPVTVNGSIAFAKIAVGNGHSCGLTASGLAYCWGGNQSGQLGDLTQVGKLSPVGVKAP